MRGYWREGEGGVDGLLVSNFHRLSPLDLQTSQWLLRSGRPTRASPRTPRSWWKRYRSGSGPAPTWRSCGWARPWRIRTAACAPFWPACAPTRLPCSTLPMCPRHSWCSAVCCGEWAINARGTQSVRRQAIDSLTAFSCPSLVNKTLHRMPCTTVSHIGSLSFTTVWQCWPCQMSAFLKKKKTDTETFLCFYSVLHFKEDATKIEYLLK